jgi:hypothetical protein
MASVTKDRVFHGMRGSVAFETGLTNRKSVLGEAHVDRSLAAAGDFAGPWQAAPAAPPR